MKYNIKIQTHRIKDKLPVYIEGVLDITTPSLSEREEEELVLMAEFQANGNDVQKGDVFRMHPVRVHIHKKQTVEEFNTEKKKDEKTCFQCDELIGAHINNALGHGFVTWEDAQNAIIFRNERIAKER